jgi:hypothetical protein
MPHSLIYVLLVVDLVLVLGEALKKVDPWLELRWDDAELWRPPDDREQVRPRGRRGRGGRVLRVTAVILVYPSAEREPRHHPKNLGTSDQMLGIVIGFYFGSSMASRAKDTTINTALQAIAPPTPSKVVETKTTETTVDTEHQPPEATP